MAFFKFRWPTSSASAAPSDTAMRPSRAPRAESIEVMRRRARHRLIGAAVLVLLGVIGFPMLFDTQPRPIPVDIPIEMPDRNKVAPLVVPADGAPEGTAVATNAAAGLGAGEQVLAPNPMAPALPGLPGMAAAPVQSSIKPEPKPEPKPEVKPPKPEPKPEPKPPKPEPKPEPPPKPEPKPEPKPARVDEAARARALLEGRNFEPPAAAAPARAVDEGKRFTVQIGAFADGDKALEVRQKLESAGLKAYTQVIDTKDGKRTRVRVGPFNGRAEADKAAERTRGLGLPAVITGS